MDLRLRTVEDEKADRDAAAAIAAVAEFAAVEDFAVFPPVAESAVFPPAAETAVFPPVAEPAAFPPVAETAAVEAVAPVAESAAVAESVNAPVVSITPGSRTAVATAAEKPADRRDSVGDLEAEFDLFVRSRAASHRSQTRSPSLADSSGSQSLDERFETVLKFSTPPGNSTVSEPWTDKTVVKFSTPPPGNSSNVESWTDKTVVKFSTPPPRSSDFANSRTDKTVVKFSTPPGNSANAKSWTDETVVKFSTPPGKSTVSEPWTDKTVKFSTPPPRSSASAEYRTDKTVVKFSTPPPRYSDAAESWITFDNAAEKSRSCSDLEVDFDLLAWSRASPLRALEKSETTRPQSVPGKSKTRPFAPKPSFQPRSLFFPEPTETPSLRFPESSSSRPHSLCFPEPSETSSLYFPEPSKTGSLCFPDPSRTRPLSFVESSKTSFPIFADSSDGNPAARNRSCSESEVSDFDRFVQSRASPSRAPETSRNSLQSLLEKKPKIRQLSFAESPSSVPEPSQTRPESSADSSKTRSSCSEGASRTSPQGVSKEPRPPKTSKSRSSCSEGVSKSSPPGVSKEPRPPKTSKTRSSCSEGASRTSPPGVSKEPKTFQSRSPPVPESLRPRHASMDRQENSLKDLQHLRKQPKKKRNALLMALNPVHLHPPGTESPKKKTNKGKYEPL